MLATVSSESKDEDGQELETLAAVSLSSESNEEGLGRRPRAIPGALSIETELDDDADEGDWSECLQFERRGSETKRFFPAYPYPALRITVFSLLLVSSCAKLGLALWQFCFLPSSFVLTKCLSAYLVLATSMTMMYYQHQWRLMGLEAELLQRAALFETLGWIAVGFCLTG